MQMLVTRTAVLLSLAGLASCGGVNIATESSVPTPLVEPLPITVGVYYSEQFSKYAHNEERWGVDWKADLGPYHVRMANQLFTATFREIIPVTDMNALPANPPYQAIIEPRIEQYSFITPRDTGAKYFAVTIRYRLNVFAPNGVLADTLTFTGYGSDPSGGITSTTPMVLATKAAMRDAAAKFLVQFPEQDVTKRLVAGQPLTQPQQAAAPAGQPAAAPVDNLVIESVPIVDPNLPPATSGGASPAPAPGTPPPAPPETQPSAAPADSPPAAPPTSPTDTTQEPVTPPQ